MTDTQTVSLVLGGTGAVGSSLARQLAAIGQTVVVGGRDPDRLAAMQSEGFDTVSVDASVSGSIEAAVADVVQRHGTLHGVANCIGSILLKPAHLTTHDEFASVLQTNLGSAFETVSGAAKAMRRSGGVVVLVSTAAARLGIPGHEAIAAAKGGVEALARSAAATYARSNIRVNVVAPGLVRSGLSQHILEREASATASLAMHALGRFGEPEDIASLMFWLMDPANAWITGQVIGVDGGLGSILPPRR